MWRVFFSMWQWYILSAIDLDGTKYVNLNDPITLTCNATFGKDALSSVQVDWFFNGEIIKSGDPRWLNRLRIAQYITSDGRTIVSQLHISHSLKRDDGQYVCRTINYMNGRQETDSMDVIVLNSEYSQLLGVTASQRFTESFGYWINFTQYPYAMVSSRSRNRV